MGGSQTTTQDQSHNDKTTYTPDPATMQKWGDVTGAAQGLANYMMNNSVYQGDTVAGPTDMMNSYWQNAGARSTAPGMEGFQRGMTDIGSASINQYRDPGQINLPQNFNFAPGALDFNNPWAGGIPTAAAPMGGPSGRASDYLVNTQQVSGPTVSAERVSAPGAIDQISGLERVTGPQLQNYQMAGPMNVNAPNLRDFQMQAAGNVSPQAQVGAQSWTDPGTAAQFMSPYTQQVLDLQKTRAQEDYNQQLEATRGQAAQAGAFGGTRQAVQESTGARDLSERMANIDAQGLQAAYQQAQQQFNQQQQLGMQGQQFNVQTGLQAALANQANQQQANLQNLSSFLQTQGLGAQTGLQSQLANQAAGMQVGGQNLQALLQTQGLGAQLGQQAQLANQQQGLQAALANQQGQEFGAGQQLQAGLANQQSALQAALASAGFNMQGQLANQATGLQAGLAAQQLGFQGSQFGAGQQMQANLANQAAQMQALGQQYQGGLSGAMQTQQLGMQGQIAGGQLGLQGAQQQEALRQAQMGMNLQGLGQAANIYGQAGQLGLQGFNANLQGQDALARAAASQQGYQQQRADAAYQNWLMSNMLPMQANAYNAQMLSMAPLPYTQTSTGTSHGTMTQPGPGIGGIVGGLLGGLGSLATGLGGAGGMMKFLSPGGAKGGRADRIIRRAEGGLNSLVGRKLQRYAYA